MHPQTLNTVSEPYKHLSCFTQGRSLETAIRGTIYYKEHYNQITSAAYSLIGLYCKAAQLDPIVFNPLWASISENDFNQNNYNLSYQVYFNNNQRVSDITPNRFNIIHIPKGKTYIKEILKRDCPNAINLTDYARSLVTGPAHYVGIYKNIPNTNSVQVFEERLTNTITLITDIIDVPFVEKVYTLIPLLYDDLINYSNLPENNVKALELVKNLFKILYAQHYLHYALHDIVPEIGEQPTLEEITMQILGTADDPEAELARLIRPIIGEIEDLLETTKINFNTFLGNLKTIKHKRFTKDLERNINNTQDSINSLEQRLTNCYSELAELYKKQMAYKNLPDDNIESFVEMLDNPAIEVIGTESENSLTLRITAPAQHFLSEDFEVYEKNKNSILYTRDYTQACLNVLHKIFVTREYKLILQAVVKVSLNEHDTSYLDIRATRELTNYTEHPNPHLYMYDCWSTAKANMYKYATKGEYDLMFLQMIAAIQSINIAEVPSFINGLLLNLFKPGIQQKTHLVNRANKVLTFKEAMDYEKTLIDANINEQEDTEICDQ